MRLMTRIFLGAALLLCAASLFAGNISLTNSSFESGSAATASCGVGTCVYSTGTVSGWTLTNVAGVMFPGDQLATYMSALDQGNWWAWANATAGSLAPGAAGSLSESSSVAVTPNLTYSVTVDIGHPKVQVWTQNGFAPYIAITLNGVAVQTWTLALAQDPGTGKWLTGFGGSWTAPANATGVLGVIVGVTSFTGQGGNQAYFDNVNLNQVQIPEPASMALAGLGLIGLALIRRKK